MILMIFFFNFRWLKWKYDPWWHWMLNAKRFEFRIIQNNYGPIGMCEIPKKWQISCYQAIVITHKHNQTKWVDEKRLFLEWNTNSKPRDNNSSKFNSALKRKKRRRRKEIKNTKNVRGKNANLKILVSGYAWNSELLIQTTKDQHPWLQIATQIGVSHLIPRVTYKSQ